MSGFVERLQRERAGAPTHGASAPPVPSVPSPARAGDPPRPLAGAPIDAHAESDYPKFYDRNEVIVRSRVARVATVALPVFLLCAAYSLWSHRAFNPIGLSSHFWIDIAKYFFPDAYVVSVAHNFGLGAIAAWFLLATTVGHVDPPGDPRRAQTIVWRRQTRSVAFPGWVSAAALGAVAVALGWKGYPLLAVMFEAPGTALALYAAAQRWVPVARRFLWIETYPEQEGMVNQVVVGGGRKGMFGKAVRINHADVIFAERTTAVWEYLLGVSGLRIHYFDGEGRRCVITIRALGSHQLVESIAAYLNGPFKIARPLGKLPPNFRVLQTADGRLDPNIFLPPPQVRRVPLWPW